MTKYTFLLVMIKWSLCATKSLLNKKDEYDNPEKQKTANAVFCFCTCQFLDA